jgi:hypothetical protein
MPYSSSNIMVFKKLIIIQLRLERWSYRIVLNRICQLAPSSFEHISRISSHTAVFFSHNKSANSTFSHNNPAKRTDCWLIRFIMVEPAHQDSNPRLDTCTRIVLDLSMCSSILRLLWWLHQSRDLSVNSVLRRCS